MIIKIITSMLSKKKELSIVQLKQGQVQQQSSTTKVNSVLDISAERLNVSPNNNYLGFFKKMSKS